MRSKMGQEAAAARECSTKKRCRRPKQARQLALQKNKIKLHSWAFAKKWSSFMQQQKSTLETQAENSLTRLYRFTQEVGARRAKGGPKKAAGAVGGQIRAISELKKRKERANVKSSPSINDDSPTT